MILTPRYIYIHIPKTAGRSIQAALASEGEMPLPDHVTALDVRQYTGAPGYAARFSFAFVRDPWQLEVSLYFHTLQNPEYEHHAAVRALTDFREYVAWMVEHRARTPQHHYVADENCQLIVNFVGRYERLQDDFATVCRMIGCPGVTLPHIGRGAYGDWQAHHDQRTIEAIARYYSTDIELFGYTRPS